MDAHGHGHRRIAPRYFLQDIQVREHVEAQPVVFLRDEHAQKTQLPQLVHGAPVERILVLVTIPHAGPQLPLGKPPGQYQDLTLLIGEPRAGVRSRHRRTRRIRARPSDRAGLQTRTSSEAGTDGICCLRDPGEGPA